MDEPTKDPMTLSARLLEELNNVASTGHRGLWPGDTITHESAYALDRLGLIRRREDGCWVVTSAGERLLARQVPSIDIKAGGAHG